MTKVSVRALMPFNAYGYLKSEGEIFEVERAVALDLEKIGFVTVVSETKKPK